MSDFPPRIALDGCENAYACFRLARATEHNGERRKERLSLFAVMAKDYDGMVRRRGSLFQKWKSRIIIVKMKSACRKEGIAMSWTDDGATLAGARAVRYGLVDSATVLY